MTINKKHKLIILIAAVAVVLCALTAVLVFLSCKTDNGDSSSSADPLPASSSSVDPLPDSSSSSEIIKTTQLLKPKNVRVENGILKWNAVKNADYYIICYSDKEIEVESTEFSVTDLLIEYEEVQIRIKAASRQSDVKSSDFAWYYLTDKEINDDKTPGLEFFLLPDGKGYSVNAVDAFKCSGVITIPSRYKGKPVTKIADKAFYAIELTTSAKILYNPNITAFEIPDTITEIGENAFCGCGGVIVAGCDIAALEVSYGVVSSVSAVIVGHVVLIELGDCAQRQPYVALVSVGDSSGEFTAVARITSLSIEKFIIRLSAAAECTAVVAVLDHCVVI